MNVLICTPFGPAPHRIHPLTQQSIDALCCAALALETSTPVANHLIDLCDKYNRARQAVLEGGYDAMLHVDADMVVPMDTLERLCAVDTDVAYGLYVARKNPGHWLCWLDKDRSVSLNERPQVIRRYWSQQRRSYGAGMGCTLIKRHVLERLQFRTNGIVAADWTFAQDCVNYGFSQAHDLGCVCGHIDNDKVLWADPGAPDLYRVEAI